MPLETRHPTTLIEPSSTKTIPIPKLRILSSVTAIIPAFNEAKMIGGVLEVLRQVNCLEEIIVVDDGSTDRTCEAARKMAQKDGRVRIIQHRTNHGKGQAVFTGWQAADAPFLLLLDADLIALKPQHILDLMQPVLGGEADMTLGLFRGGYWNTDLSHFLTPWLSGQRCLRSDLLAEISARAAAGYGLETAMTVAAHQHGWRCKHIIWRGVAHPAGENHRGLLRGIWNRVWMYGNIVDAWLLAGGIADIYRLWKGRGKYQG